MIQRMEQSDLMLNYKIDGFQKIFISSLDYAISNFEVRTKDIETINQSIRMVILKQCQGITPPLPVYLFQTQERNGSRVTKVLNHHLHRLTKFENTKESQKVHLWLKNVLNLPSRCQFILPELENRWHRHPEKDQRHQRHEHHICPTSHNMHKTQTPH